MAAGRQTRNSKASLRATSTPRQRGTMFGGSPNTHNCMSTTSANERKVNLQLQTVPSRKLQKPLIQEHDISNTVGHFEFSFSDFSFVWHISHDRARNVVAKGCKCIYFFTTMALPMS